LLLEPDVLLLALALQVVDCLLRVLELDFFVSDTLKVFLQLGFVGSLHVLVVLDCLFVLLERPLLVVDAFAGCLELDVKLLNFFLHVDVLLFQHEVLFLDDADLSYGHGS